MNALRQKLELIPGLVDLHLQQVLDYPTFRSDVDRVRAAQLGLSSRASPATCSIPLSSSALVAPSYFLNPQNNVNYIVAVKEPLAKLEVRARPLQMPITPGQALTQTESLNLPLDLPFANAQSLSNLVNIHPAWPPTSSTTTPCSASWTSTAPWRGAIWGRWSRTSRRPSIPSEGPAARDAHLPARAERGDERFVPQSRAGAAPGHRSGAIS